MKMMLFAAAALIAMPAMAQQTGSGGVQTNGGQTKPGTNAGNSAIDMQNTPQTTTPTPTTMPDASMPSTTTDSTMPTPMPDASAPSTSTMPDSSTMPATNSMNSGTMTTPPASSSTDYPRCKSKTQDHCRQAR